MRRDATPDGPGGERPAPSPAGRAEVERTLHEAHRYAEEGDWEGVAQHLRDALEDHPDDPWVLCWLGVAERELGLDGIAYERFKRCLATGPEDPHVLATAGNAVAEFDDPAAEPALRTAAMFAPELALARWMYGAYLSREGQTERGVEELRAARELAPEDPVVAFELGVGYALAGDRPRAVESLFRAVELDRHDGWSRVILGMLLVREARVEEAARELVEGARLRPDDVEAQLAASLAAAAAEYDDLAWEMLERARLTAGELDRVLAGEVEERIESGAAAAVAFLESHLLPASLRERLMTRP